ncbi:MAG: M28 family metallopeptidase [Promethearchaeota archaeon]
MSTLNLYNQQAALNHVKNLAFKRRAASEGETKVTNYIIKELDKEKIQNTLENFDWYTSSIISTKLGFVFFFIYIFSYGTVSFYPHISWIYLSLDILYITIIYCGVKYSFGSTRYIHFGKEKESKNVIATIQGTDLYPKRPVIIFSAHHDTISQRYSMKMKIWLYRSALILFLLLLILTFILSITSLLNYFAVLQIDNIFLLLRNISLIIVVLLLINIALILGNKNLDESIGSIDNASGTAILLELARLINKNPLEKSDVIFIWCGAEEVGYMGSKQYCLKHFEELNHDYDLNKSYNINIDMVGTYLGLLDKTGLFKKRKINLNLNNVLEISANHQKISFKKENMVLGNFSDHKIFQAFAKKAGKNGFQISVFNSDKDTKYIHSKRDTPDKCSITNLNSCINICYNAIKSLDLRVE